MSVQGPSVVCGSRVTFISLPGRHLGRPLVFSWNITLDPEESLPQATTLAAWPRINEVLARDGTAHRATDSLSTYTFDPSGVSAGTPVCAAGGLRS